MVGKWWIEGKRVLTTISIKSVNTFQLNLEISLENLKVSSFLSSWKWISCEIDGQICSRMNYTFFCCSVHHFSTLIDCVYGIRVKCVYTMPWVTIVKFIKFYFVHFFPMRFLALEWKYYYGYLSLGRVYILFIATSASGLWANEIKYFHQHWKRLKSLIISKYCNHFFFLSVASQWEKRELWMDAPWIFRETKKTRSQCNTIN